MGQSSPVSKSNTTPPSIASNPTGKVGQKGVVEAKNQTSKKWFIIAILVGSAVLIGAGGFGAVGLLQSHGVISLPQSMQWLSSAIGTVGNTPHFWSLWTMTGGALLVGSALIAMGSRKIHQIRKEEARAKEEAAEALRQEALMWSKLTAAPQNLARDYQVEPLTYSLIVYGKYQGEEFIEDTEPNRFDIVVNRENKILSSGRMTLHSRETLVNFLKQKGYSENK